MLPPTESPATAMRSGCSWLAAPSRTIHCAWRSPAPSPSGSGPPGSGRTRRRPRRRRYRRRAPGRACRGCRRCRALTRRRAYTGSRATGPRRPAAERCARGRRGFGTSGPWLGHVACRVVSSETPQRGLDVHSQIGAVSPARSTDRVGVTRGRSSRSARSGLPEPVGRWAVAHGRRSCSCTATGPTDRPGRVVIERLRDRGFNVAAPPNPLVRLGDRVLERCDKFQAAAFPTRAFVM